MPRDREIVITGMGVLSPIGIGKEPMWAALREGRSGVKTIEDFEQNGMPVHFGAPLTDFDPKQYVTPRKSIKVMSREVQTGMAAASLAMQDAGLERGSVDPGRLGVIYGCEFLYSGLTDVIDTFRGTVIDGKYAGPEYGPSFVRNLQPLWMLKYLPNMAACHVAIAFDARAALNTIVEAEASGLLAIIEAARVIERGAADVVIAGGSGNRLDIVPLLFRGDEILSHRNDDPTRASRPFDAQRDGTVNGEGAAALILEERRHAESRGATIYARLLGGGSRYARPEGGRGTTVEAITGSMQDALTTAELTPGDIGHVNANGFSLVEEDRIEAEAISAVVDSTPVTAPKSYFGNLGSGTGLVEAVISLLALEHREIPATLNYEEADPACPINVVHGEPQKTLKAAALTVNQTRIGQAAAVVFGSP